MFEKPKKVLISSIVLSIRACSGMEEEKKEEKGAVERVYILAGGGRLAKGAIGAC